jgi:hypothetical protein
MHMNKPEYRDLVVCNNCQWLVSLLEDTYKFSQCPQCRRNTIETIPVDNNEWCSLHIDKRRGLAIEFQTEKRTIG